MSRFAHLTLACLAVASLTLLGCGNQLQKPVSLMAVKRVNVPNFRWLLRQRSSLIKNKTIRFCNFFY